MTQQKIKELLTKTFGEEEANDPDVVRLYTDCLRQAVEEVTNEQSILQSIVDDFAKAALTGLITNEQHFDYLREPTAELLAKYAYGIAEAMMQERERRMNANSIPGPDTKLFNL